MIESQGVLFIGKPGSGKSDLALRLIDRGANLISDDVVKIIAGLAQPEMYAPEKIAGKLEVRNIGIFDFVPIPSAPLCLCVQLDGDPERLPAEESVKEYAGFPIPKIAINAFEASAPIKVELALRKLTDHGAIDARI